MDDNKKYAIELTKALLKRNDIKLTTINGDIRFIFDNSGETLDLTSIVHEFWIRLDEFDHL